MRRKPELISGQNYHIFNRGVSKRHIFIYDKDFRFFIFQIAAYKKQYFININKFCIMPNHFHLLLNTKHNAENISFFMKNLQYSYACYFNRTYLHSGHVFQSKFVNKAIDEADMVKVFYYIEHNPVKERLVHNVKDWPYTG
jgi:putative transposase